MKDEKPEFPMRINKYLALKQYASRREADRLIENGKVRINGRVAVLGDKVSESDKVEVQKDGAAPERVYLAYNKPIGVVTSMPQEGEESIEDIIDFPTRVFPLGRLDKESHGLIILTNDGRITSPLLDPEFDHEKEYKVTVNKDLKESFEAKMSRGVDIGDYVTKECEVETIDERTFRIVLTEGKKHQIRRMCTELGYEVWDLQRVRIMNVELGKLKPENFRKIEGEELEEFLRLLKVRA